jgi:rod shape determining protein RodA
MRRFFHIDFWLLIPVALLVSISLVTLFSLNGGFFRSQFISLIIALFAFLLFSQIHISAYKHYTVPIYITALVILVITLGIGIESRGAVRWIDIFGIRLQFSEILKPFLALAFSSFLAGNKTISLKSFVLALLFLLPIFLLVYFQPDLGSAMLYLIIAIFTLFVIGFPWWWFGMMTLPVIVLMPVIWLKLHDYQRQRIFTFLNPQSDPLGISYNSIQALIAVGSGQFMGKGISEGTQSSLRFLPERQTDFIFATIAEGLGFIGTVLIILSLLFLCYRVYCLFRRTSDGFIQIFSLCAFGFFLIPSFINIGMNVGIVPIVGVTLPFVSFGGSSLLSNFIFLGILSAMSSSQRHKDVLEIK